MQRLQANAAVVTLISFALACLVNLIRPADVIGRTGTDFSFLPRQVGEWSGYDTDPGVYRESVPGSSLLMRDYINNRGDVVNLTVVYGTDIADIHNPEYCFQGQGWKETGRRSVSIRSQGGRKHAAKCLLLRDSLGNRGICLYWYAGYGGATDSLAGQRYRVWKDTLLSGRVHPSALVRILAPVDRDQTEMMAEVMSLASLLDDPLSFSKESVWKEQDGRQGAVGPVQRLPGG